MPTLEEVARAVGKDFDILDTNKDSRIDFIEFKALKAPTLTDEQRKSLFQKLVLSSSDEEGPETAITKADLKSALGNTKESAYDAVAARLEKIFGQKVTVSSLRDFNGVPHFEIHVGKTEADADKAIDTYILARDAAGLSKANLTFYASEDGKVKIYAGNLLTYEKPNAPAMIESTFKALEKKEVIEKFKEAYGTKKE